MEAKLMTASLAYARALERANPAQGAPAGPGAAGLKDGPNFADLVKDAATEAVQVGARSEAVTAQSLTGGVELTDIVAAVSNAEITLQTVVAVRDRVISAYQEIIRMPI